MADYITMKQIPGGVVTAKDDRIVYDANMADSGIIYGCGISYVGNNMIHIAAGYGIIKGGLFEMEDHTEYVDLAENEPTTGQIYLHLDLSADDKLTIVKETTNSLHPMVQNANANFTNGIYELQLCTFTATTTALEDVTQTFEVIQNQVLDTMAEIMANTTAGLKAGALALKEVSENLNAYKNSNYDYANGVDITYPTTLAKDALIVLDSTGVESGKANGYISLTVNGVIVATAEPNNSFPSTVSFHAKKGDVISIQDIIYTSIRWLKAYYKD